MQCDRIMHAVQSLEREKKKVPAACCLVNLIGRKFLLYLLEVVSALRAVGSPYIYLCAAPNQTSKSVRQMIEPSPPFIPETRNNKGREL